MQHAQQGNGGSQRIRRGILAIGVLALGWFVLGLKTGWSVTSEADPALQQEPEPEGRLAGAHSDR